MIINRANMEALQTGYRTNFQNGFAGVAPAWNKVATQTTSTTAETLYPWLGQIPGMREWIGPRVKHNIEGNIYRIANKTWEDTISVKRDHIEDDQIGVYAPLFSELGRAAGEHPDLLIWDQLGNGFGRVCFDGQFFFDTDHPVTDPTSGSEVSVSNVQTGAGPGWYLLDTSRALKPLIYQERRKPAFTSKVNLNDSNVFENNEFVWGTDGRWNAGYGFWQMAFASKAVLTAENLRAAYMAMTNFKSDEGRPLGVKPTLLVVGNTYQFTARDILLASDINGTTNTNRGLVDILVSPFLA